MTRREVPLRGGPYMELPKEAPCETKDYKPSLGEILDERSRA